MPRLLDGVPRYRKHRASGQAIVTLSGKDFYLGPHGTKVSHQEYDRVVAEWLARGRTLPASDPSASETRPMTLVEVTAAYKRFARDYYRKRGRVTNEYTAARETSPVRPITDEIVEKTLPFLSRVVADMVRLQRIAGMRPEEVCLIRPMDIDRTSDVWIYRPDSSKMEHINVDRRVFLGPRAQLILAQWLNRSPGDYCVSPREAERERRAIAHGSRTIPLSYGNRPGSNRQQTPKRAPGDRYTTDSYRRAICWACDLMSGMPERLRVIPQSLSSDEKKRRQAEARQWRKQHCWAPNRLRHATGTQVREQFGLEAAQLILGYSRADVTQIYA